jgi:hypothetical protein
MHLHRGAARDALGAVRLLRDRRLAEEFGDRGAVRRRDGFLLLEADARRPPLGDIADRGEGERGELGFDAMGADREPRIALPALTGLLAGSPARIAACVALPSTRYSRTKRSCRKVSPWRRTRAGARVSPGWPGFWGGSTISMPCARKPATMRGRCSSFEPVVLV